MEAVNRQVEDESQSELFREQDLIVKAEREETNIVKIKGKMNYVENSIGDTEGDLSEEH